MESGNFWAFLDDDIDTNQSKQCFFSLVHGRVLHFFDLIYAAEISNVIISVEINNNNRKSRKKIYFFILLLVM